MVQFGQHWKWGDYAKRVAIYDRGVEICTRFLEVNKLPAVEFENHQLEVKSARYAIYRPRRFRIRVDVRNTRLPVPVPGRLAGYSYPGHVADLTAYGVCAHWTGQHVVNVMRLANRVPDWSQEALINFREQFEDRTYQFCQAFRLFVNNPDLLRRGRPTRYWYLAESLGLQPVEHRRYEEVLAHAHAKIQVSSHQWVAFGVGKSRSIVINS